MYLLDSDGKGCIIIDVANNQASYKNWQNVYKEMPVSYEHHRITGITKEAVAYSTDIDYYVQRITDLLISQPLNAELKEYVLGNMRVIDFQGKSLLIIPMKKQEVICYYDNEYYVREGSMTKHIPEKDRKKSKRLKILR